jgi:hypothetical protein
MHTADGDGGSISVGISFAPIESFTMQFTVTDTEATADYGVDAIYFSDNTTLTTRLNEAKWKSAVIMFSPKFTF